MKYKATSESQFQSTKYEFNNLDSEFLENTPKSINLIRLDLVLHSVLLSLTYL